MSEKKMKKTEGNAKREEVLIQFGQATAALIQEGLSYLDPKVIAKISAALMVGKGEINLVVGTIPTLSIHGFFRTFANNKNVKLFQIETGVSDCTN